MKKLMFSAMIVFATYGTVSAQETPTYKETLNKLMEISGAKKSFSGIVKQMITMVKTEHSSVPDKFWTEMEIEFNKMNGEDLVSMMVSVYQRHMSEADLKEIIAFYETPVGKKYAEKTPILTQESMSVGRQWGAKIAEKIIGKLTEGGHIKN